MHIIAGRFKGQEIKSPKNGETTRPTTDRAKEAIFSHLEAIGVLSNARVADVYAGTGALGFEALSRGACSATFVEANAQIAKLIALTAQGLKGPDAKNVRVRIVRTKAEIFSARITSSHMKQFDVIFIDPPYAVSTDTVNEQTAQLGGVLSDDGVMMVERSIRTPEITAPWGFETYLRKDYGETAVFYLRKIIEPVVSRDVL
ncbi:16S rRNA (guanine(966)-N(2))-methyltransferase RsmD [Alloscardovia venturai]|uniref:16S rRNA (Guanine(966)-N(2))-methyltransferase RsmD n=1 Tax=Alloscardovia venturai TaxID=1769421 RepID=A0ABW2Y5W1_9BIFI